MNIRGAFGLRALGVVAVVVWLVGCNGTQGMGSGSSFMSGTAVSKQDPYKATIASSAGTGSDLVYATGGCGGACIFSLPDGSLVDSVSLPGGVGGDCSDTNGNVFITNGAHVLEYAHGGTEPIATLNLPGSDAAACSVDTKSGNLAVVFGGSGADIAVFPAATGTPTLYEIHFVTLYCGYDGAGNLFVSGYASQQSQLAELPAGTSTFTVLSVSQRVGAPGQIQWDGKHITYESRSSENIKVSRLKISGPTATIVGTTHFKAALHNAFQSWIYGNRIIIPYSNEGLAANRIAVWKYPQGGEPLLRLGKFAGTAFMGVTVSI